MEVYYITGSSRGIGHHLALEALNSGAIVYGYSRNCTIEHNNFHHGSLDLTDLEQVKQFELPKVEGATKVVLINNAGTLGEMKYVGDLDQDQLISAFNVNLIAPSLLMNKFLKTYASNDMSRLIFNISSGAANNPYDGWSAYCSTKAGLDMFGKVVDAEQRILNSNLKVMSVAPGIIGTKMQEEIRNSDSASFSLHQKFIEFHENGDLKTPESSAKELINVIQNQDQYNEVVFDLRYS
jgi:benzil reductase ((S)-benzoin forming)